ncbi:MAG TPA: chemotaxis protein CheW, partial [Anaeromyxobacteraceae bacterium]|nr:chemotaxis protein CheW [Anaeromyxobacteraceae bacterium]
MPAFVVFEVASQTLALPAAAVERVLRMAALGPLHGAPAGVDGVLDLAGDLVPVVDLAARLGLASRPPRAEDHLLVVRTPAGGRAALRVARVRELAQAAPDAASARGSWAAGAAFTEGALRLPAGLAPVPDLGRL